MAAPLPCHVHIPIFGIHCITNAACNLTVYINAIHLMLKDPGAELQH